MKNLLVLFICLFTSVNYAQNYKEWSKKRTNKYDAWSKAQNWEHNYFKWNKINSQNNDKWDEQNGWDDSFAMDNEIFENISNTIDGVKPTETPTVNSSETTSSQNTPVQIQSQEQISTTQQTVTQNQNNVLQAQIVALQAQITQLQAETQPQEQTTVTQDINQAENQNSSLEQITALQEQIALLQTENSNLISQQQATNIEYPKLKIWAVIIGVAKYRNPKSRLNYCDDDAYKIYGFLKSPEGGALPDEQIMLLIDEDAQGYKIKNAISSFTKKAGKNDAFLLYYSGHGSPNSLLGEDYDVNASGVISHSFINSNIANCNAKYTYCIIDACHSGNITMNNHKSENAKSIAQLESSVPFYSALNKADKGTVYILSSKSEETSLEVGNKRQGIFSYYFIDGLKGSADYNKDGIISVTEVFDYTQKNVVSFSKNKQNPIITGNFSHTMPISIVRKK